MYALIDCNSFYANCEKLFRPDLKHKPVVVLSNNDGCVVARSEQAKALGIKMGVPYFQVKNFCQQHGVQVFSSNYALYADLSNRVMNTLALMCPTVEVYSIDEAFLYLGDYPNAMQDLNEYARMVKDTVYQHTGIPVSVGIAPTKTLAKLANYGAKKYPATKGVCVLDNENWTRRLLSITPVGEVWGIGKRLSKRLNALGIETAYQLSIRNPKAMRQQFSVVMERICRELNGQSCLEMELIPPNKKQIISSRSFSTRITNQADLNQAINGYVAKASCKLREQNSLCRLLTVFAKSSAFHASESYVSISGNYHFITPTNDTRLLIASASYVLDQIYKDKVRYAKAGVILLDICQADKMQTDLFDDGVANMSSKLDSEQSQALMQMIDNINKKANRQRSQLIGSLADKQQIHSHAHSQNALFFASEGIVSQQKWQMSRHFLSPCYTTRVKDLVGVGDLTKTGQ